MATRALIGVHVPVTDEIKYIYIHHGHPMDIGEHIKSNYYSDPTVHGFIDGGDMSSCGEDGRGRGGDPDYYKFKDGEDWEDIKPRYIGSRKELVDLAEEDFIYFVYVWNGSRWEVACACGEESRFDFMPLKKAMKMIANDKDGRW